MTTSTQGTILQQRPVQHKHRVEHVCPRIPLSSMKKCHILFSKRAAHTYQQYQEFETLVWNPWHLASDFIHWDNPVDGDYKVTKILNAIAKPTRGRISSDLGL